MKDQVDSWFQILEQRPQWAFMLGFIFGFAGREILIVLDILIAWLRRTLGLNNNKGGK